MNLFQQVKTLVYKDVLLEWRSKYAINGILLYVVSTVFVCYQAFTAVDSIVWNALFWIIMLFASINAISRSFVQESTNRQLYYYSIVDAKAIHSLQLKGLKIIRLIHKRINITINGKYTRLPIPTIIPRSNMIPLIS